MAEPETLPSFPGWDTLEKLGEGGMCAVFRVRPSAGGGPERAIKVLQDISRASSARFTAEARLLTRIDHPNVLRVYSLHDSSTPPWIVMDLLAGRDLEETRDEQGPMDPEQAARIFADLASGMSLVHELGVRHRDIKPANLMLGHDGVVRVIDFGIARNTGEARKTREGLVVGTAAYLPPEIFTSKDSTNDVQDTVAADVYALAQSMLELVCGVALYERESRHTGAAMLVQIMQDKMDRPHLDPREWRPQVPAGFAEIIIRATAQDPAHRTSSMRQLENELRAWLSARRAGQEAPLTAVDPSALPPPPTHTAPPSAPPKPHVDPPAPSGVSARAAGAAAASILVLLLLMSLLFVLLVAGLLAVWALAPHAPDAQAAAIARDLGQLRTEVESCAQPGARGRLLVEGRLADRHLTEAHVATSTLSGARAAVEACVLRQLTHARWPEGPVARVHIPIHLE